MESITLLLFAMLAAYFSGALPTAVVVARRVKGINILEHGSGNPGASNVYRILGAQWATATLLIDVFKGYFPVWLIKRVAGSLTNPHFAQNEIAVMGWIALAAFAGHVFSPFLKFKGGKGAATGLGAMFALAPQATTLALLVYGGALYLWKRFSAGTLAAAIVFPVLLYFREGHMDPQSLVWGMTVPLLLALTHRRNIMRMIRREELPMHVADGSNEDG